MKQLPPFLERAICIRSLAAPSSVKLILHTLNARANTAGQCWPSLDQLATDSGLARSTCVETLRLLRLSGLILVTRGGERNHRNVYTLTLDKSYQHLHSHQTDDRSRTSPISTLTRPTIGLVPDRPPDWSTIKRTLKRYKEEGLLKHDLEDANQPAHYLRWFETLKSCKLPIQTIMTWLICLVPIGMTSNALIMEAPSQFHINWINSHFAKVVSTYQLELHLPIDRIRTSPDIVHPSESPQRPSMQSKSPEKP